MSSSIRSNRFKLVLLIYLATAYIVILTMIYQIDYKGIKSCLDKTTSSVLFGHFVATITVFIWFAAVRWTKLQKSIWEKVNFDKEIDNLTLNKS
jgi:hypothetical protein